MKKCQNYKKYKGIKYPTCNNNKPCDSCLMKFLKKHFKPNGGPDSLKLRDL